MNTVVIRSIVEQDISFPLTNGQTIVIKGKNKSGFLYSDTVISDTAWDCIKQQHGDLDLIRLGMIIKTTDNKASASQSTELDQMSQELGVEKVIEKKRPKK